MKKMLAAYEATLRERQGIVLAFKKLIAGRGIVLVRTSTGQFMLVNN